MSLGDRCTEDEESAIWEKFRSASLGQLLSELTSSSLVRCFTAAKELHCRGGEETFRKALELCNSQIDIHREVGAFLLGQLGTPKFPFAEMSIPILLSRIEKDSSPDVRAAAAAGIGHLSAKVGSSGLSGLALAAKDISPKVRACAAFSLGRITDAVAIELLLKLTHDKDDEVRSWAAFGLSALGQDTLDIRSRLVELLADLHCDVREEAIVGLAKLKDHRVFDALQEALSQQVVLSAFIEAAGDLGDKRLLPALHELRERVDSHSPDEIDRAIELLEKAR